MCSSRVADAAGTRRAFTLEDQRAFAALTGDWNPLHVDAVAARRLMFGAPVVHGVHLLLWALDVALADEWGRAGASRLRRVSASFAAPVRVGTAALARVQRDGHAIEAHIRCDGRGAAVVRAELEPAYGASGLPRPGTGNPPHEVPLDRSAESLADATGTVTLQLDEEGVRHLFPRLAARLPALQIAELAAATRVVGMHCPGLHSLFSRLDLAAIDHVSAADAAPGSAPPALARYAVARPPDRFGRLVIRLEGATLAGTLEAFVRPAPVQLATMREVAPLVHRGEFRGQRALVVGGSRGLGEACARLLAAGGADVCLTYRVGMADAERVAADVGAMGGTAHAVALDAADETLDVAAVLPSRWRPTHLYYFATPFIFDGTPGAFSGARFERFARCHVGGFARLVQALAPDLAGAYYPSTSALEELPADLGEYVAAKAAGEALCRWLGRVRPELRILASRLPRTRTDQTASLFPVASADAFAVLLGDLRRLRDAVP